MIEILDILIKQLNIQFFFDISSFMKLILGEIHFYESISSIHIIIICELKSFIQFMYDFILFGISQCQLLPNHKLRHYPDNI